MLLEWKYHQGDLRIQCNYLQDSNNLAEMESSASNVYGNEKKSLDSQTILKKYNEVGRLIFPNFKTYYSN